MIICCAHRTKAVSGQYTYRRTPEIARKWYSSGVGELDDLDIRHKQCTQVKQEQHQPSPPPKHANTYQRMKKMVKTMFSESRENGKRVDHTWRADKVCSASAGANMETVVRRNLHTALDGSRGMRGTVDYNQKSRLGVKAMERLMMEHAETEGNIVSTASQIALAGAGPVAPFLLSRILIS